MTSVGAQFGPLGCDHHTYADRDVERALDEQAVVEGLGVVPVVAEAKKTNLDDVQRQHSVTSGAADADDAESIDDDDYHHCCYNATMLSFNCPYNCTIFF